MFDEPSVRSNVLRLLTPLYRNPNLALGQLLALPAPIKWHILLTMVLHLLHQDLLRLSDLDPVGRQAIDIRGHCSDAER